VAEETDVRRGGGADAPVEFRWNGQLHQVRAVLSHQRIRHSSYSKPPADAVRPVLPSPREREEAAEIEVVDELSARRARRIGGPETSGASPTDASAPPTSGGHYDQEIWRVRASQVAAPPPALIPGVFDLRFDWAVGRWNVTRIDIEEKQ
jgi:hypothetical protein